ncbi:hypothetical protein PAPYR_290 [Paratrimastix pyriformis]|uniref:AMP-activated protein kinase glycogen-binding domain-containing protein n=1 Tax=Paratrimastix pyriformis TaxID=342808 RepID=A0ABQ8UVC6_9EUKA|nr:hypothetical protein PAPYR_290 [Paratrimastix pyriformis]
METSQAPRGPVCEMMDGVTPRVQKAHEIDEEILPTSGPEAQMFAPPEKREPSPIAFVNRYSDERCTLFKVPFFFDGPDPDTGARVEIKVEGVADRFEMKYDPPSRLWKRIINLPAGTCRYLYVVNGTNWLPDPAEPSRIQWSPEGEVRTILEVLSDPTHQVLSDPPALVAATEAEAWRAKQHHVLRSAGLGAAAAASDDAAGIGSELFHS